MAAIHRAIVFLFILLPVVFLSFFSTAYSFAASRIYNDVPKYDQNWFNGSCSGDCAPTAGAMILGWFDSHGWPRMVHGGSNDYAKNPIYVTYLAEDLSVTMQYLCDQGTYVGTQSAGLRQSAKNMDSGANFTTYDDASVVYSQLAAAIDNQGPLKFGSQGTLTYHYGTASTGSFTGGHAMAMIGYDDGGSHYGSSAQWIVVNMGWGTSQSPAWIDISSTESINDYRVYAGGTPSADDDDFYEDNDYQGDAAAINTPFPTGSLKCNDNDWYKVWVPDSGGTIDATISFVHASGDIDFQLYNASGSLLQSSFSVTDQEHITYTVPAGGAGAYFFLRVYGYSGATNSYSMSVGAVSAPVNGTCGSSDGGTFTSSPMTNLCSAGDASGVTTNAGNYTWSCSGNNGGTTASCSATRAFIVTPIAGSGGIISPNTAQTAAYNQPKQFTVTPDVGYTAAVGGTCGGSPASGTSPFTYTTNTITANCTVSATFTATPLPPAPEGSIPVGLQLACPVKATVGQPLTVTVNLYNWDCYESMSVNRFMMSVMGNADGTLSGFGIFGPYNRWLGTPRVLPPADCGTVITPGTVTPFNLTVMNAVPSSLSGKMATVDIEAITNKGQTFGGGECVVNVVP